MSLQNIDVNVVVPNVDGYLNMLNNYADSAINSAGSVAHGLNSFIPTKFESEVSFEPVTTAVSLGSVTKPVAPSVSMGVRNLPSSPSISTPLISIGSAPIFSEPDPSLNLPTVPSPLSLSIPVKDFTVNVTYDYPVTPDTTLPSVPTLVSLNLPTLSSINLPTFDLDFPTSNSLIVPGVTFSFSESAYSSPLLISVKNELLSRLSNSTGLNPIVEQAIWDRGRDREQRASLQAERTLLIERGQTGFSRPSGSTMAALDMIVQETQSKIIDLSRDIMIKQAELEQENIKSSIQQTLALEDILIRESNNIVQRSFESAKYIQDIQIEIFKSAVAKYSSEVEAYKAFSTSYEARVRAELSKVEIFKAQIEGEKLKGDINEQNIRIYIAQLEGIKSNVEIYKALISTISEKIKAESLKIELFRSDIEAYSIGVRAKADEYSIYSEQIKGELAKVEIFDSKVKAYTSRIQAYAAQSDTITKRADVEATIQGLSIKKYEADVEAFIKQVQADQLVYQSAVDLYKGESQLYLADVSLGNTAGELSLKSSENTIQQNKYKAELSLENAKVTLSALQASYQATLEGKKAAGSIYSQIGASALSAINVSASLQGSVGISASESHDYKDI